MTRKEIGLLLSNERAEKQITKYRARASSGLIETQIDHIEGSTKNYTIDSLIRYAKIFDLHIAFVDNFGKVKTLRAEKIDMPLHETFNYGADVLTFVEATSKKGSITCGQCFFNDTCDATYACKGYDRKDGTDGYFINVKQTLNKG